MTVTEEEAWDYIGRITAQQHERIKMTAGLWRGRVQNTSSTGQIRMGSLHIMLVHAIHAQLRTELVA